MIAYTALGSSQWESLYEVGDLYIIKLRRQAELRLSLALEFALTAEPCNARRGDAFKLIRPGAKFFCQLLELSLRVKIKSVARSLRAT